ncbi:MAG: hypothetical protein A2722_03225 [Candidatus Doudnabacteria bacterium RIFCSPHIGHO2_01_FULL_50_11]|uniref:Transcription regulator TrmB N-terminal domain-containing protein n=1 Tax=Candidatus Doudnabacteria bacterium RIFCSPHIGHO2_01_FULL_50_11 TaxID=1817828 RepID=A0A1F5PKF5_9BACT|nr:MAG: hypothetical protein A2722_03225 [Candidatus Doudnabacteria bacterium RIFCSPHIGHO2_01_FULL_50_11]HLC45065.1 helix-turn-helix domain-containing protein [Patescibacteria group bacterium]
MENIEILEKIGLSEKESSVYLSLLELGVASVDIVAKKAGTKRPTTYLILDSLQKRGLVSMIPRAKKTLYQAESPQVIISDLNRRQELFQRFLPNLLALHNARKEKPAVQLYEGKQAVREIYERILSAKEVEFFSTIRDIVATYPDYPKLLNDQATAGKVIVREFLTRSAEDIAYAKVMQHNENFQQRFAPGKGEFLTDNCLFDGHVVFFSFQPYIFAVVITSQGIYQSLRNLFEYAWQAADEYEKVIKPK